MGEVQADRRAAIVEVAARLLREHGPAAVTTRGVAEAAGVQAPAIYRLFGDKDGLMEAVAEHVMATFVAAKEAVVEAAAEADVDPLDDLRAGWDAQIEFALINPALFALLSDPERGLRSAAAQAGRAVLEARVRRVAATGRLRVSEQRAVELIRAGGSGVVLATLSTPVGRRDPGLGDAMFESLLGQILTEPPERADGTEVAVVVALRSLAPSLTMLSEAERHLLAEWSERVVEALA